MYVDNLTIVGVLAALVSALLPFLFGKESWRVEDTEETDLLDSRPLGEPLNRTC